MRSRQFIGTVLNGGEKFDLGNRRQPQSNQSFVLELSKTGRCGSHPGGLGLAQPCQAATAAPPRMLWSRPDGCRATARPMCSTADGHWQAPQPWCKAHHSRSGH